MRALLRPFALHAAYTPIETIVFFSIIGTLAYFHILSAIKHSAFLAPTQSLTPALRPAHALYRLGEWVGVRENSRTTPIEIQQVVISLDAVHRYRDVIPADISLASPPLSSSTLNLTNYFTHSLQSTNGHTYPSICHRPVQHSVNRSFGAPSTTPCFTHQQANDRTFTQTLTFHPGMREEFVNVLTRRSAGDGHGRVFSDEAGVRFEVESPKGAEALAISQMRHGKWVAYAARALVVRFWDLAKKADSLDILLILAGYILMHITFYLLLTRSRRLGSSFWLPLAILSSAILALLLALPIAMYLHIPIDPVALTEALPFLVCTVGFDKPLRLARAVFTHPHLTSPMPSGSSLSAPSAVNGAGQLKPAPKIITESLTLVYPPIIRDYILEIAVLVVGANSKVGGLREVCALAALILGVDCMLLCTYLAAILGVMIEVRRIKTVRAMTRSRSNSVSSASGKPSAMVRPTPPAAPPTLGHKISCALLGEKGSSLPGFVAGSSKTLRRASMVGEDGQKQENPVARLKLLLIASFLTLHILNLITPLTPTRTNSHSVPHVAAVNVRKVDITAPGIRSVLQSLVDASAPSQAAEDGSSESDDESAGLELLVKVTPPIYIRVLPPAHLLPARIGLLEGEHLNGRKRSTGEWLESFMSSWTRLVGDPILSKWIVVVLAISISLNGYLLQGIALGVGVRAFGVVGRSGAIKGGVRFDEGEEVVAAAAPAVVAWPNLPLPSPTRGPASPAPAPASVATFTLEDVDRRLKATKRLSVTTSSKPAPNTPPLSSSDTDVSSPSDNEGPQESKPDVVRSLEECIDIFENGPRPQSVALSMLNDEEVVLLAQNGKIAAYALEKVLGLDELERAVKIRRALISRASLTQTLETSDIPVANYDYSRVLGACCENVIGYIPIPLGIAGPLNVDGTLYPIPMATAEGTLVASTSRGCKALNAGGGVTTVLVQDAMTRGPAIDFPTIVMAAEAKAWIASEEGYSAIKTAFESTSRFAKLKSLKTAMAGRTLFVRFATATGDAMGMNMISKGTEKGLEVMQKYFPEMVVLALSGNYCTDKKPAAINWIEGRGKSVVAEAVIPGKVVKTVLKTTVEALCNLNTKKNLVGSAMAGSIGGFNAHAANILTAMFLATGQDPAQNVESSNCMTLMEPVNKGEDLLMTITMPSIEVGTVGGGTVLAPQQGVLEMLGMKGAHPTHPGQNAQALARLIAAAVMAGELSLLSALAAGHLIRAHMAHNRSQTNTPAASLPPTPAPGAGPVFSGQLALPPKRKTSLNAQIGPLTPSSSTGSLPPYSRP